MKFVLLAACVAVSLSIPMVQAPAAGAATVPFQRGVTMGEWGQSAYQPRAVRQAVKRLRRMNVDTVTLFVVYMQSGETSNSVRRGSLTARDRNLVKAIREARKAGLRVVLRPYVDREDHGWRGQIKPGSVDAWFRSYSNFIVRYARIAQRERVKGLVVGSEMVSLSPYGSAWRALVARVRSVFGGFVSYQANWDEFEAVSWWDVVDVISISAYFPLSLSPNPSVAELATGWRNFVDQTGAVRQWFNQVDAVRLRFAKPVVFGEIGYLPVTGTAVKPWDTGVAGTPTATAQSRPYQAAFDVWYRVPWFRGFHWWIFPPNGKFAGRKNGHEPASATLEVLKRNYGSGP